MWSYKRHVIKYLQYVLAIEQAYTQKSVSCLKNTLVMRRDEYRLSLSMSFAYLRKILRVLQKSPRLFLGLL